MQGKRVVVKGQQREQLDPLLAIQVLLAIGVAWDDDQSGFTPDVFRAAIEDSEAAE